MKILVAHLGTKLESFVASSLNKRLLEYYDDPEIDWLMYNHDSMLIFQYNRNINKVYEKNSFKGGDYDVVINLHPLFFHENFNVSSESFYGFHYSEGLEDLYELLYGDKKINMNLFQVYFRIAGFRWKGEFFDFQYFPQTRSKKNRAGIAVAHSNLRLYVDENLDLSSMKKWTVPKRKNIFKQFDEINRCSHIITDDVLTMNFAVYLNKKVHYLNLLPLNFNLESFGRGEIYPVPASIVTRYG